ncbi:MAG: putative peptidoglycan glycosyltransferase FtsW [Phycisphaeraceae bacterium]
MVMTLLGLAVVMVQSAGMTMGQGDLSLRGLLANRTTLYAAGAVLVMLAASRFDIRTITRLRGWTNPIWWVLGLSLALVVAAMIPGVGLTINGSHRWLRLGPAWLGTTFQPSELVKWAMVAALALWCARRQERMTSFWFGLLPALAMLGLACLLIVKEDLGTAALVGLVAMIMLLAAGVRWWHLGLAVPPAVIAAVLAVASSPYRRARLTTFLDPWADPQGSGYQPIQSMLALAQGGLTGRGLGNGIQKFGYLPVDTSDCIFAVICEELGLAGALVVIGLYLAMLWVGLMIVRDCKDRFAQLFALGVMATVGIQATINIAVVTVVVPTKGIALPLLSAGGTGWIVTALALGLVAGLDRQDVLLGELDEDELVPAPA